MIDSILIFSRAIPQHQPGGMETFAWSLAAEWAKAVPDVQIVTTSLPGAAGRFTQDAITVTPLGQTPPGRYSRAWWRASRASWRARTDAPSIVVSVSAGAYSVVVDRARHPCTPFVLQVHGTAAMEIGSKLRAGNVRSLAGAVRNGIGLPRDMARHRRFDRVIAVGDNVLKSLRRRPHSWSVRAERLRLIANGVRVADLAFDPRVRHETRARYRLADGVPVVACVGRLHVQKQWDRAIRVAALLRDSGSPFRFLLIGDGADEPRLRGLVQALRLEPVVTFVGRVEPARIRDHYAAADVALLTTARLEGLPMAVLEALACGLPCVVPAGVVGAALRPLVVEADPANPPRLAGTLRAVVGSRGDRASRLPDEYTLEHCARAYLTDFDELVHHG